MAKIDQLTNKRAMFGNTRSHAMNHSRRTWGLNLQKVKIYDSNNEIKEVKVTARTLKSLKKHNKVVKLDYKNPAKIYGKPSK